MAETRRTAPPSAVWTLAFALLALVTCVSNTGAEESDAASGQASDSAPLARVESAPGGGEMIMAGPQLEYISRARIDADQKLTVECNRPESTSTGGRE